MCCDMAAHASSRATAVTARGNRKAAPCLILDGRLSLESACGSQTRMVVVWSDCLEWSSGVDIWIGLALSFVITS